MSLSDIAERICVIAWMLQKDDYLDEAAGWISLVGQGKSYNASRAAAARVLLYHPTSEARKKVLFELLHNAEEYTNKAAYRLTADIELTVEDYRQIEQNAEAAAQAGWAEPGGVHPAASCAEVRGVSYGGA